MTLAADTLAELNGLARDFYREQLERTPAAQAYWASRGLSPATIDSWQLGYAPRSGRVLLAYLQSFGWGEATVIEAGLARATRTGGAQDVFRDRYVHPIFDREMERVLGFSCRRASDDDPDVPKYLNTSTTPLFDKSREVYGWPNANSIQVAGEALVVEGNVDMLALYEAGIANVVALCGTALTSEILYTLADLAPRITLVLDSDTAGQKATIRSLTAEGASEFDLGVIPLEGGKDPAAILRDDPKAWPALAAKRRTRWQHLYVATLAPYRDFLAADVETRVAWKDAWGALVREHATDETEGAMLLARCAQKLAIDNGLLVAEFVSGKTAALPSRDEALLVALALDWPARRPYAPYLVLGDGAAAMRDAWCEGGEPDPTARIRRRIAGADRVELDRVWNKALGTDVKVRLRARIAELTRAAVRGDTVADAERPAIQGLLDALVAHAASQA